MCAQPQQDTLVALSSSSCCLLKSAKSTKRTQSQRSSNRGGRCSRRQSRVFQHGHNPRCSQSVLEAFPKYASPDMKNKDRINARGSFIKPHSNPQRSNNSSKSGKMKTTLTRAGLLSSRGEKTKTALTRAGLYQAAQQPTKVRQFVRKGKALPSNRAPKATKQKEEAVCKHLDVLCIVWMQHLLGHGSPHSLWC